MPDSPSRSRGGQPGNTNALKHGFYTRRFHKRDLSGVDSTSLKGLTEEIALIRIFTRHLVESAVQDPDYYDIIDILRAVCLASGTINRIIKTQSFLASNPAPFYADVDEAIRQLRLEFGLDQDPSLPSTPLPDYPGATGLPPDG